MEWCSLVKCTPAARTFGALTKTYTRDRSAVPAFNIIKAEPVNHLGHTGQCGSLMMPKINRGDVLCKAIDHLFDGKPGC